MSDLKPGDTLSAEIPGFSQARMTTYGKQMGTYGAIHTDPEFAKTTPQGTTIVQGMLVLAPLDRIMRRLVGAERWLTHGRTEVKIVGMTRPDQATRIDIEVLAVEPQRLKLGFTIRAGEATVIVGEVET
jgi:acyl dehydratase